MPSLRKRLWNIVAALLKVSQNTFLKWEHMLWLQKEK